MRATCSASSLVKASPFRWKLANVASAMTGCQLSITCLASWIQSWLSVTCDCNDWSLRPGKNINCLGRFAQEVLQDVVRARQGAHMAAPCAEPSRLLVLAGCVARLRRQDEPFHGQARWELPVPVHAGSQEGRHAGI